MAKIAGSNRLREGGIMRRSLGVWAFLGIVILCGWAKPAFSQGGASAAQLNGTVRDASGGSVAKASLTLRDIGTNRTYTAVSNDNGLYVIPNLPPGNYELTTEATGFAKSTQTGIVLTVGQVATIDVTVSVAQSARKSGGHANRNPARRANADRN